MIGMVIEILIKISLILRVELTKHFQLPMTQATLPSCTFSNCPCVCPEIELISSIVAKFGVCFPKYSNETRVEFLLRVKLELEEKSFWTKNSNLLNEVNTKPETRKLFQKMFPTIVIPESTTTVVQERKKILVVGQVGTGKSSLIGELTQQKVEVSDKAKGCTFDIHSVTSDDYVFYDTCGLNEAEYGTVKNYDAVAKIVSFLQQLVEGLNLIILVHRGRITESFVQNYKLFYEVVCGKKVPIICVVTGAETQEDPSSWVNQENLEMFEKHNLKFATIISTCFGRSSNKELEKVFATLRTKSANLLKTQIAIHTAPERIPLFKPQNLIFLIKKIWNYVCDVFKITQFKNVDKYIMSVLKEMSFTQDQAIAIAEMIDFGFTSTKEDRPVSLPM